MRLWAGGTPRRALRCAPRRWLSAASGPPPVTFFCLLLFLPPSPGLGSSTERIQQACDTCRGITKRFSKGLTDTAKKNFGGGNTAWEEKTLSKYETSSCDALETMADKENQIPETSQKDPGRPKRRLRPRGYYQGLVGLSQPLCPLGTPTRLRGCLPEEKLRKYKSAEDLYLFTAKTKKQPRSVRKPACTLLWGDEESDDELNSACDQGLKTGLQRPPGETPNPVEDVDGGVLATPGAVLVTMADKENHMPEAKQKEEGRPNPRKRYMSTDSESEATSTVSLQCLEDPDRAWHNMEVSYATAEPSIDPEPTPLQARGSALKKSKAMRSIVRACLYGILKQCLSHHLVLRMPGRSLWTRGPRMFVLD